MHLMLLQILFVINFTDIHEICNYNNIANFSNVIVHFWHCHCDTIEKF